MKEEIKMAASISAKSSLRWLVITVCGTIITMLFFTIILFQNADFAGGGHGNVYAFIIGLAMNNIPGFILLAGAPIFAILYFLIANKVAIQQMIYLTWKNENFASYLNSKVVFLVEKITASNNLTSAVSNQTMLKLQLLEANRNDKESSRIKKRIINYVFKKINLDDVDFSNKELKYPKWFR
nr:hypothetical protein [uncultured Flavobacterium sp.]